MSEQIIWQQNLRDAITLAPLTLIHGNVKDRFFVEDSTRWLPASLATIPYVPFDTWLAIEFEKRKYNVVILYDVVDHIVCLRGHMVAHFERLVTEPPGQDVGHGLETQPVGADGWLVPVSAKQDPKQFFETLYKSILPREDETVAVICRFSDRFLRYSDKQDRDERLISLLIQKAAMTIPPPEANKHRSRIAMIFDLEGGIPQELNACAPFARSILIPPPTLDERREFFRGQYKLFFDRSKINLGDGKARFNPDDSDPKNTTHLEWLTNVSNGLSMRDLFSLAALSWEAEHGIEPEDAPILFNRFRFGTNENAWTKVERDTLLNASETLRRRVKGQDEIIDRVVPVLACAKLGMTDAFSTGNKNQPRGTFFFVGPTGVGKTELSKAIAALIFGDEAAMIRFDMSEYSEEHQQSRLVGAPPGYVGFDQGGQLTEAIKKRPFSVVLFDEIEKAHPRIWDKFLQVLEDGRLTDGMGRTVYFSEAILIFTSNLGTAPRQNRHAPLGAAALGNPYADGAPEEPRPLNELSYEELQEHFRREVEDFFVNQLGRREILGRFGKENILVFKFLTDQQAKEQIVKTQINRLCEYLAHEHDVTLLETRSFRTVLLTHPEGFERNGARGVKNLLTTWVLHRVGLDVLRNPDGRRHAVFRIDYEEDPSDIASPAFRFHKVKLKHWWEDGQGNRI